MNKKIKKMTLAELRKQWAIVWGRTPHARIGRATLEKSIEYKMLLSLPPDQQKKLDLLIRQYKRSPKEFNNGPQILKPGTRLVRHWKGQRHSVLVRPDGFEYRDRIYSSLSRIANDITGTNWNGRVFFGVK